MSAPGKSRCRNVVEASTLYYQTEKWLPYLTVQRTTTYFLMIFIAYQCKIHRVVARKLHASLLCVGRNYAWATKCPYVYGNETLVKQKVQTMSPAQGQLRTSYSCCQQPRFGAEHVSWQHQNTACYTATRYNVQQGPYAQYPSDDASCYHTKQKNLSQ